MAGKMVQYQELSATQLAELDREHTLALMAFSPLEVHGPHLPTCTDLLVALELQKRAMEQVGARWPETDFLILPPTYMGDPSQASAEAGERMLDAHVAEAIGMLAEVRAGKPPFNVPVG